VGRGDESAGGFKAEPFVGSGDQCRCHVSTARPDGGDNQSAAVPRTAGTRDPEPRL
jgi:hypothetical protein